MNILFQLSGSIACYKACTVISRLAQSGHSVQCVASESALKFIGAATLEGLSGKALLTDTFAPGRWMEHIELNRWADISVLCPATANRLNKMAAGVADDLLGNLWLTHDFTKPLFVAPAMNTKMWTHPITQESLQKLESLGVKILRPEAGNLACGDVGEGRLMEPEELLKAILK
ncbi:MAG: flavoprotein [Armatimonadetes bacterium]|nr:flavoprotein [Armatimonadota bacterium]